MNLWPEEAGLLMHIGKAVVKKFHPGDPLTAHPGSRYPGSTSRALTPGTARSESLSDGEAQVPRQLVAPVYESVFVPPARPSSLLRRGRLSRLIHKGTNHRLTVISAPAGYGKTVALTDWRATATDSADVAWLTMGADDADPARFWSLVVSAVQRTVPDALAGTRARLDRDEPPQGEMFVCQLVNDLCMLSRDTVLVIDDFVLETDDARRDFTTLVAHLPPNVHIILSCRAKPDMPVAQWKTDGTLFEIGVSDLQFTDDEAEAYLDLTIPGELDGAQAARLLRRCDGWIAGLYLATLGILETARPRVFIEHLVETRSAIVDYLVAEVVARLPRDLAAFLKDTAVVEEMSGAICDAITQRSDSAAVLENMRRAELFISASSGPGVYRYHPLFKGMLIAAQEQENPDRLALAHRRAASWMMKNDRIREAVVHSIAAGDHTWAAKLLVEYCDQFLAAGPDELLDLLRRLPEVVVEESGALRALRQRAEFNRGSPVDTRRFASGEGHHSGEDDMRLTATLIAGNLEEALELISTCETAELPEAMRGLLAGKTLTALERIEEGAQSLRAALDQRCQDDFIDVAAASLLAWNRVMAGHLGAGRSIAERTLKLSSDLGIRWFREVRFAELALAQVAYDRGLLDEGYRMAHNAIEAPGQCGLSRVEGAILLSRLEWALGNTIHAHEILSEAVVGIDDRPLTGRLALRVALTQAELHLKSRDPGLAESWLPDWRTRVAHGPNSPLERLVLARFLMADDHYDEARELLATSEKDTDRTSRYLLEAWRLGAIAAAHAGDPTAPMALEIAYAMAAPEGFAQAYVEDSTGLLSVARDGDSGVTAAVGIVHTALAGHRAADSASERMAPPVAMVEELTDREIAVLRLLPSRLSNKEIAHELFVSVNTVKSHVKSIYRKLGVTSRNAAVSQAASLRLM